MGGNTKLLVILVLALPLVLPAFFWIKRNFDLDFLSENLSFFAAEIDAMAVGLLTLEVQNSEEFGDSGGVSESFCFSIAVADEIIAIEANVLVEDSNASENEVTVILPKRKCHKPSKVEVFDKQTGPGVPTWLAAGATPIILEACHLSTFLQDLQFQRGMVTSFG